MNYLAELNAFHRWLETHHLPVPSQLLWFKLMDLCNRCGWAEWMLVDNCRLRMMTGLSSEKSAIKARDDLVSAGIIEFRKGKKGSPNKYKLLPFHCKNYSVNDSETVSKSDSINDSTNAVKTTVQTTALNKHKQKQNRNVEKKGSVNTPQKRTYGKHENVMLTENEYEILQKNHPELLDEAIEFLSEYIESNGYKAKSHYSCMTRWVFHAVRRKRVEEAELTQREARVSNYKPSYQPKKEVHTGSWLEILNEMETNQIIETEGTEVM